MQEQLRGDRWIKRCFLIGWFHVRRFKAHRNKRMDLEDRWIRIRAEDQRQLFGFVPFGKRLVNVGSQAKDADSFILRVSRKVCFGTDHDTAYFTWSLFQELLNQNRKVM